LSESVSVEVVLGFGVSWYTSSCWLYLGGNQASDVTCDG
jgi:hypothetical protein